MEFNDRKVGVQTREPAPWGQGPWASKGQGCRVPEPRPHSWWRRWVKLPCWTIFLMLCAC